MEKTTKFDLTQAIHNWRNGLSQSPAFRGENLDELEAHLSDSIAGLESRGLSGEEAFIIAIKRIGKADSLEMEFGKINASSVWLDRILCALIGIQVWALISSGISAMTKVTLSLTWPILGTYSIGQDLTLLVAVSTLFQILGTLFALSLLWWLIAKKGRNIDHAVKAMLARRSVLIGSFVGLCLLTLGVRGGLKMVSDFLLIRSFNIETSAQLFTSLSYSQVIVSLLLAVGLIVVTLLFARQRLSMRGIS